MNWLLKLWLELCLMSPHNDLISYPPNNPADPLTWGIRSEVIRLIRGLLEDGLGDYFIDLSDAAELIA